jgi:hypothetical protein
MAELLKKFSWVFFCGLTLCALALPAHGLSLYTRGTNSNAKSNSPNRFNYTDPFYQKRKVQPKTECKSHGQAICLNPKKPNPFVLTRQNPNMQKPTVHPYLRKVFKPSIQRIN